MYARGAVVRIPDERNSERVVTEGHDNALHCVSSLERSKNVRLE